MTKSQAAIKLSQGEILKSDRQLRCYPCMQDECSSYWPTLHLLHPNLD